MVFHLCPTIFRINETLFIHAFIVRLIQVELLKTLSSPLTFFVFLTEAEFSLLGFIGIMLHRMINKIPLVPKNNGVVMR